MSAISFRSLVALLEVVKGLWFKRGRQFPGPGKGQPTPHQGGKSCHRHSAFFELP
jgi:hypothetical protein